MGEGRWITLKGGRRIFIGGKRTPTKGVRKLKNQAWKEIQQRHKKGEYGGMKADVLKSRWVDYVSRINNREVTEKTRIWGKGRSKEPSTIADNFGMFAGAFGHRTPKQPKK